MHSRPIPSSLIAALAGATLTVAASSAPASAFTLASPSLPERAAAEHVAWCGWGYCHRYWGYRPYYRPYYYRPHYYRPYYHPWRHCWWTAYGRVCRWY